MIITILLIAVGLSMDTFSLSIIYGTLGLEKKKIITLSLLVGLFHYFMPLLGDILGENILNLLPLEPSRVAGIIFLILAIQMFISSFKEEETTAIKGIFSMLLFALTVSLDSFSVGIGLSTTIDNIYNAALCFSITSFLFTFCGLFFGKELNNFYGKYSTIFGSVILFVLSIYYIFVL